MNIISGTLRTFLNPVSNKAFLRHFWSIMVAIFSVLCTFFKAGNMKCPCFNTSKEGLHEILCSHLLMLLFRTNVNRFNKFKLTNFNFFLDDFFVNMKCFLKMVVGMYEFNVSEWM